MDIVTPPPAARNTNRLKAVRYPGLLLILLLAVLAAGCAPQAAAGSWAGLTLDPGGLVMANIDRVTRLNENGVARWEFPPVSERERTAQFYAEPAVTEDVVYIGGFNHHIYALNRENGQTIWINSDPKGQIIAGLLVAGGKVFAGLGDQNVMAFNQRNGQLLWTFETEMGIWTTPLYVDGVLYVPSMDQHLYAVNAETGQGLWTTSLAGAVAGTPAYEDGTLYVGTFGGLLYAINASDGSVRNTFRAANWVWGGPALVDGVLYFGDMSGILYAVQAETLNPIWQRQVAGSGIRQTPLVLADRIIVGSRDGQLYAVKREDAQPIWTQNMGAGIVGNSIQLENGLIVISTLAHDRQLVALTPDGQQVWQYPIAQVVTTPEAATPAGEVESTATAVP